MYIKIAGPTASDTPTYSSGIHAERPAGLQLDLRRGDANLVQTHSIALVVRG
ncbi:hypothetical protein ACTGJ9_018360 [Bradyrhizobium sp. RDM12]